MPSMKPTHLSSGAPLAVIALTYTAARSAIKSPRQDVSTAPHCSATCSTVSQKISDKDEEVRAKSSSTSVYRHGEERRRRTMARLSSQAAQTSTLQSGRGRGSAPH